MKKNIFNIWDTLQIFLFLIVLCSMILIGVFFIYDDLSNIYFCKEKGYEYVSNSEYCWVECKNESNNYLPKWQRQINNEKDIKETFHMCN